MADEKTLIQFDGVNLQDETIITEQIIGDDSLPSKSAGIYELPIVDGAKKTYEKVQARRITLIGNLKSATASGLIGKIEEFKELATREEKTLTITYPGSLQRIYTASVIGSPEIQREFYHVTIAPFKIEFICLEPYAVRRQTTISGVYDISAQITSVNVSIDGTAPARPVIYFNTTVSGSKFILQNNTTNETIEVATTFSGSGRQLKIDTDKFEVKIDGVDVEYRGSFPDFVPGTNELTIMTVGQAGSSKDQYNEPTTLQANPFGKHYWVAQKFTPTLAKLLAIELYLAYNTDTPVDVTVEIRNNNGGVPGATVLGSGTIQAFDSTTPAWKRCILDAVTDVTPGTDYWIVFYAPSAFIAWVYNFYVAGLAKSIGSTNQLYSENSGATWNMGVSDLYYRTYADLSGSLTGKLVIEYNPRIW